VQTSLGKRGASRCLPSEKILRNNISQRHTISSATQTDLLLLISNNNIIYTVFRKKVIYLFLPYIYHSFWSNFTKLSVNIRK